MDKIQTAKYGAALIAGLTAGHLGTPSAPNYAGVEIKEQSGLSFDANGTDGSDIKKMIVLMKTVDAEGNVRVLKIPGKDFREVK